MRLTRLTHQYQPRPTSVPTADFLMESECEAHTAMPPTHILVDIPDWQWQEYIAERHDAEQESWR